VKKRKKLRYVSKDGGFAMTLKRAAYRIAGLTVTAYRVYTFLKTPRDNLPPLVPGQPRRIKSPLLPDASHTAPKAAADVTVNVKNELNVSNSKREPALRVRDNTKAVMREVRDLKKSAEKTLRKVEKTAEKAAVKAVKKAVKAQKGSTVSGSYASVPELPAFPAAPKAPDFPGAVSFPRAPRMPKAYKSPKPAKAPKAVPHPGTFKYVKVLRMPKTAKTPKTPSIK